MIGQRVSAEPVLLATYATHAGPVSPIEGTGVSPWNICDRIAASATAGFRGFGFGHADVMTWADRIGWPAIADAVADNGITVVEFETLFDWWADDERRTASNAARDDLLLAIERIGVPASHIKFSPDYSGEVHATEAYAAGIADLADHAADVGARVALEIFPFSDLDSPVRAVRAVELTGRTNAGVCLDIWHVERGGISLDTIRSLPGEYIAHIELNDALAEPVGPLMLDSVDNRRLCGEGDFDLQGFVDAVRSTRYSGAWGVEIVSAEQRQRPLTDAVARAHDTALASCFGDRASN